MNDFQHDPLVLPLDPEYLTEAGLPFACALLRAVKGVRELHLLHVIPPDGEYSDVSQLAAARRQLERVARQVRARVPEPALHREVRSGDLVETIVDVVRSLGSAELVMAPLPQRRRELVSRLVERLDVPIFVVPSEAEAEVAVLQRLVAASDQERVQERLRGALEVLADAWGAEVETRPHGHVEGADLIALPQSSWGDTLPPAPVLLLPMQDSASAGGANLVPSA